MSTPFISICASSCVQIQPTVLYNICDIFNRLSGKQSRILGSLLGSFEGETVLVKNCFAVIHDESDGEVALDVSHQRTSLALHQRIYPNEHLIGWFSTGTVPSAADVILHNYYSQECASPLFLMLDTNFATKGPTIIRTYISRVVSLGNQSLATEFVGIPNMFLMTEINKIGFEKLASPRAELNTHTSGASNHALYYIKTQINALLSHIQSIGTGGDKGDPGVGCAIAHAVNKYTTLPIIKFNYDIITSARHDSLLVYHVSQLFKRLMSISDSLLLEHPPTCT